MSTDRPKVGGIWALGSRSPLPGRLVVIAGRVPTGGHFAMFALERPPDVRVNDIPVDVDGIRWFEEPQAVAAVAGALPVPLATDDLERRVAVARRKLCDEVVAALRRALAPEPVSEDALRNTFEPSSDFVRDVADAHRLQTAYEERILGATDETAPGREPSIVERTIGWLRVAVLPAVPSRVPQGPDRVGMTFRDEAGVPVAAIDGRLGDRRLRLVVDFDRIPVRPDAPVVVTIRGGDGAVVAEAEIRLAVGRTPIDLLGDAHAATRADTRLEARQPPESLSASDRDV